MGTTLVIMIRLLLLFTIFPAIFPDALAQERSSSKPNIIYILADDLGYGEVGVYGQDKIQTPNIDRLAVTGTRFTQHYTGAPVCAPARYILMTGLHSGHAYIRGNDEAGERGEVWNYAKAVYEPNLEGQRVEHRQQQEHQTMHRQTCSGRAHENQEALFAFSQQLRWMLNHHIPCRMMDGMPPLQAFPQAAHSGKHYDPRQETIECVQVFPYLCYPCLCTLQFYKLNCLVSQIVGNKGTRSFQEHYTVPDLCR